MPIARRATSQVRCEKIPGRMKPLWFTRENGMASCGGREVNGRSADCDRNLPATPAKGTDPSERAGAAPRPAQEVRQGEGALAESGSRAPADKVFGRGRLLSRDTEFASSGLPAATDVTHDVWLSDRWIKRPSDAEEEREQHSRKGESIDDAARDARPMMVPVRADVLHPCLPMLNADSRGAIVTGACR